MAALTAGTAVSPIRHRFLQIRLPLLPHLHGIHRDRPQAWFQYQRSVGQVSDKLSLIVPTPVASAKTLLVMLKQTSSHHVTNSCLLLDYGHPAYRLDAMRLRMILFEGRKYDAIPGLGVQ